MDGAEEPGRASPGVTGVLVRREDRTHTHTHTGTACGHRTGGASGGAAGDPGLGPQPPSRLSGHAAENSVRTARANACLREMVPRNEGTCRRDAGARRRLEIRPEPGAERVCRHRARRAVHRGKPITSRCLLEERRPVNGRSIALNEVEGQSLREEGTDQQKATSGEQKTRPPRRTEPFGMSGSSVRGGTPHGHGTGEGNMQTARVQRPRVFGRERRAPVRWRALSSSRPVSPGTSERTGTAQREAGQMKDDTKHTAPHLQSEACAPYLVMSL